MIDTQGRKGQDARGGVIQFLLHCLDRVAPFQSRTDIKEFVLLSLLGGC